MKKQNTEKVLEETQHIVIPEEHKNIVRRRMKASETDPSRVLKWEEVKHKIKFS